MDGPIFDFHTRLVPRPGAMEALLGALDAAGIDRAAVAAGGTVDRLWLSRALVEGGHVETDADNAAVLLACQRSGDRLVPIFFANPHRGAGHYATQAEQFRGLEISPAVHGVPLADSRITELVSVAEQWQHSVYVVCLSRPGSEVADLVALAERAPGVTFVLGHTGVGNIDYYGIELVAPHANVLVETSGGYSSVLRHALDRIGPSRLLFGSEFPLQAPGVELAKYAALSMPADHWRQVAWDNATRLVERNNHDADPRPGHHPPAAAR